MTVYVCFRVDKLNSQQLQGAHARLHTVQCQEQQRMSDLPAKLGGNSMARIAAAAVAAAAAVVCKANRFIAPRPDSHSCSLENCVEKRTVKEEQGRLVACRSAVRYWSRWLLATSASAVCTSRAISRSNSGRATSLSRISLSRTFFPASGAAAAFMKDRF